jgi:hypothetical protein
MKTIIERFREELRKAYNDILPEDLVTDNSWFENFIQSELKALRDEIMGRGYPEIILDGDEDYVPDYKDGYAIGHDAHRQHCIDVFNKFGIK